MTDYYYETTKRNGYFQAESDEAALERVKDIANLLILYKESDTINGTPFIVLKEITHE